MDECEVAHGLNQKDISKTGARMASIGEKHNWRIANHNPEDCEKRNLFAAIPHTIFPLLFSDSEIPIARVTMLQHESNPNITIRWPMVVRTKSIQF